MPKIHETACVDPTARIGDGTSVWHFCHIMKDAQIGENCTVGQNCFVAAGVTIGNNCKIQNNVSVYSGVTLEDYVFCGPSMVFTNVKTPRCAHPRNNPASDYRPTLVKRGASIGANATILSGITIGENALIGAGAVVTKDVLPFALILGVPGTRKGWACECGQILNLLNDTANCPACPRTYKLSGGQIHPCQSVSIRGSK
jgi:UDP-2-acetamido-3-amino-2,3-dideoxy-glucuronate N-acetyltransferase